MPVPVRALAIALLGIAGALATIPPTAAATAAAHPGPASTRSAAGADAWSRRAGAEVRSKHYRIASDLGAEDTDLFARHLDLFFEAYAGRMQSLPQQSPETPRVLMFRSEADYLAVLRERFGVDAEGSDGASFSTAAGPLLAFFVESRPRSQIHRLIQREGFRQFASVRFPGTLPPWAVEGLAEFFAAAFVLDGRVVTGATTAEPLAAVRRVIERRATIPLSRLLSMSRETWDANSRAGGPSTQLLQSWSLVEFLLAADGSQHRAAFDQYLRLVHGGATSERAFKEAFGVADLAGIESAWTQWAVSAQPSPAAEAVDRLSVLAEGLRLLSREGVRVDAAIEPGELVSLMRDRSFVVEVSAQGRVIRTAASESLFELPVAEGVGPPPRIELRASKPRGAAGPRSRAREEAHPAPPTLATNGLAPREITVEWTRLPKSTDFTFRLTTAKRVPARPPARESDAPAQRPAEPPPTPSER